MGCSELWTQPHICSENRMFKIDFCCRRKIEFIKKGGSEYLEGHLSHIGLFMRMSGIEKWNRWFVLWKAMAWLIEYTALKNSTKLLYSAIQMTSH